ncbi:GNAT family N-acetyltransferase [Mangrovicoccus sp. HB161399]|uniref:GNAT family N-acetyltransferase n=1 Tax=Mangrovicoccus sp. HB161399 TaxID=2720392 RepID=UPI001555E3DF|nr:GNAT family N-acetyltransferase [Mangrovicoccus sp. HB161399]
MAVTGVLRPARPDDLAALDALLAESYPRLLRADYPPSVMVLALPLIARAQPKLLACGTYHVVEHRGRLIGAGGWTPRGRDPGRADIRHVAVDWRFVRQGVAGAILRHALSEARAAGVAEMRCEATRTAVPFYRAMGFRDLGEVAIPLAPGVEFPAVRMVRML